MAILKITCVTKIEDSINTDNFTGEEWKEFIKQHVTWDKIVKVMQNDMFPLAKLKELAIASAKLTIDDL